MNGYRQIGVDLVIGFLARNGDGGDVLKSDLVHSHSKANEYVVAERRRDALAYCCPSNPLARNLVILGKTVFDARRSNCGVLGATGDLVKFAGMIAIIAVMSTVVVASLISRSSVFVVMPDWSERQLAEFAR